MQSETILYIYIGFGLLFTILEHFSYDWSEMDEMSFSAIVLNILQQTVHYSRYLLTWPWYLVEDLIVMLANKFNEGD